MRCKLQLELYLSHYMVMTLSALERRRV